MMSRFLQPKKTLKGKQRNSWLLKSYLLMVLKISPTKTESAIFSRCNILKNFIPILAIDNMLLPYSKMFKVA